MFLSLSDDIFETSICSLTVVEFADIGSDL